MVTTSLLAIGLLGLGALAYVWLKDDKEVEEKKPQPPVKKKAETKKKRPANSNQEVKERQNDKSAHLSSPEKQQKAVPLADEFPLRLGSKGKRVERLKIWLMRNHGHFGIINDEFDQKLEELVMKKFKKSFVTEKVYRSKKMGQPIQKQPIIK